MKCEGLPLFIKFATGPFLSHFNFCGNFVYYSGMIDAWSKIYRYEGTSGLYRGFWVSTFQIVSGVFYISTYEGVRHALTQYDADTRVKSLVAGGCASLVGQTIVVPFDVLSQHLMVLGVVNCGRESKVY